MAKTPTVNTITSGYASQTQLNENFTNIQTAFENTLSLDGSTPNAMGADLDLNNNDILNIGTFQAQNISIGGSNVDISDLQTLTTIAADIQTLADIEDGTENTDAIQGVAAVASEIGALGPISSDISTLAAISTDVTTVVGNATNISTVAGVSTDVTTVAGISTAVSTVAADGVDIGVVAGLTTELQTLAPISTDISTVSGISSDVTAVNTLSLDILALSAVTTELSLLGPIATSISTVSGISADVTSVANSAADITAISQELDNLQTLADDLNEVSSDISTVSASIDNVNLVGGSITSVNTVASNLTSINSFFEVYRTGASEPSTSLDEGDLFYDTTANTLKVYTGTGWEAGVTAGSGFLPITGGTLTGALTLSGDPTLALQAATKQYAESTTKGISSTTPTVTYALVGDGTNYVTTNSSTAAMLMPSGTTAERPTGNNGMIRYNSEDAQFEGFADGAWGAIAGGGGGGDTQTANTTSTVETPISIYNSLEVSGVEVTVVATDTVASERSITKLLLTHDGTTTISTQYGELNTGATAVATYDVDLSGGYLRLLATAASANSTNFTISATILA